MNSLPNISPAHAMDSEWREWHAHVPEDEVPAVNNSFNRAWMAQQKRIDDLERKMRVMQFAIQSTVEVLKHGTTEEMREAAGFLSAIKRITEHD